MRFEAEEVKAVALGTGWVAAITSLNFLRVFTEGGLQVCNSTKDNSFYDLWRLQIFGMTYHIF